MHFFYWSCRVAPQFLISFSTLCTDFSMPWWCCISYFGQTIFVQISLIFIYSHFVSSFPSFLRGPDWPPLVDVVPPFFAVLPLSFFASYHHGASILVVATRTSHPLVFSHPLLLFWRPLPSTIHLCPCLIWRLLLICYGFGCSLPCGSWMSIPFFYMFEISL